jgi:SWI/SNF-related matrix-associated actin-dependent regulator 1 of chromatin subfamily A
VINSIPEINTVLVVCPASLKVNWLRECDKWLVRPMRCAIASSQLCPMPEDGFNVVIINYDICKKFPKLQAENWDLIVLDECHRLKNYKAQRTVFIYGGKNKDTGEVTLGIPAKRRLALTGTPICNRPSELYPTLAYLSPEWKTKWGYFMSRYCGFNRNRYGCDTSGATNLDELQEVLRRSVMIRRLKGDVLKELPAKTRQIIEIEPDENMQRFIDAELGGASKKESVYEELKAEIEIAKTKSEDEYRNAVTRLRQAMSVSFEELSRLRHDTAVAKIPFVIEYIKERFEETGKILLFAWHHDVIDAICAAFPGEAVHLTGSDKQEDRQAAVDGFQNDAKIKLFVGSITAAGVGLTLTAASLVIFAELDWVPGNITQAEDRAHRIGQKDAVTVQHLVLNGSIDSKMAKTLIAKQEIIEKALDVPESAEEPVSHVEQPATASMSRQKIEQEALGITSEEIEQIHADIKYLAGMDGDFAHTQNGVGFNKIDTRIGHDLAGMFSLTAKQAVLARKILKKYKKTQLQEVA